MRANCRPDDGDHTKGHEAHRGAGHDHPSIVTALPGTFFIYDLSPFVVRRSVQSPPFSQFLTGLCAIVGGVVTISGFVDSLLFRMRALGVVVATGGARRSGGSL